LPPLADSEEFPEPPKSVTLLLLVAVRVLLPEPPNSVAVDRSATASTSSPWPPKSGVVVPPVAVSVALPAPPTELTLGLLVGVGGGRQCHGGRAGRRRRCRSRAAKERDVAASRGR